MSWTLTAWSAWDTETLGMATPPSVSWCCVPRLLSFSMHCSRHNICFMLVRELGVLCLKVGGLKWK